MIEPRRGFQLLQGRDSDERHSFHGLLTDCLTQEEEEEPQPVVVVEHDEPDIPVHPALEYEVVVQTEPPATALTMARGDTSDSPPPLSLASGRSAAGQPQASARPQPVSVCDIRVLLSFLGLIVFGSLNAVTLKLQAIPMYVIEWCPMQFSGEDWTNLTPNHGCDVYNLSCCWWRCPGWSI